MLNKGNSNSKYGLNIFTTCYTPTHIITYPNGDPNDFRDIKKLIIQKVKSLSIKIIIVINVVLIYMMIKVILINVE